MGFGLCRLSCLHNPSPPLHYHGAASPFDLRRAEPLRPEWTRTISATTNRNNPGELAGHGSNIGDG